MKWTDETAAVPVAKVVKEYRNDPEAGHSKLDDLLCEVLLEQGSYNLVKMYEDVEKWYA